MKSVTKKVVTTVIYYKVYDQLNNRIIDEEQTFLIRSNNVTLNNSAKILMANIDFADGFTPLPFKIEKNVKIYQCSLEDFLKIAEVKEVKEEKE